MNELLEIIRNRRMEVELNQILMQHDEYLSQRTKEKKYRGYVLRLNLSKKQLSVINNYLDVQGYLSSIYGEVAYELGFKDGMKLMREIKKIVQ